jgi:hypothetical protein
MMSSNVIKELKELDTARDTHHNLLQLLYETH